MRSVVAAKQKYARNAQDGFGGLNTIYSTLQGANDQVRRARDLALQGINGAAGADAREALATEIDQIRAGLVSAANTTYLDRPVFGGTSAGPAAYQAGTPATYVGDGQPVLRTIADGVDVDVQVAGPAAFGPDGDSVFDHLSALAAALRSGDTTAMQAGATRLGDDMKRVTASLTEVGARTVRLEAALQRADDTRFQVQGSLSEIENTDLPKATMELQLQEVAYQASLAATARVLQPSLVDFLR
jgi:flagellar hook-associated protein 3 FlgL